MAGTMVGRTLNDRYEITERVGLGGMAEVYRANDKVLGRMVAVKVMLPQYAADPTFTQRFRQEAASAAKLQSPYIVSIYDWGLDDETYYIVMEFLRGTDLKTAIKERGFINQRKAAEIGSQVAQALSVAHSANIIHRDIKPQNIMIQPDGNIKVMDFGIARAGDAGLSQTATVLGTAHYVSPEQAQGKDLGPASDIYSLGVVLYEATTGKLPFDGQDAVSVAVKQVKEIPAPPRTINPDIDPSLEAIIMKALEKDPAARFKDASEMRRYLNDFLAGRPVNLGTSSQQTQVMNGGVAPLPMGGSTSVMPSVPNISNDTTQAVKPNTSFSADVPKKKSKKPLIIVLAILAVLAIIGGIVFAVSSSGDNVEVPNVAGQSVDQAKKTLTNAGFKIGQETEVYSTEVESGKVVGTNPEAGQKAKKGSTVSISVSKGTKQVSVPDLRGMTKDQAQKALTDAGLKASEGDTVYSSDVEEGKVAEQSIAAGNSAKKGDTVTYHLSKGEEKVTIPNVVGQSQSNATSRLEAAGFAVDIAYQESTSVEKGNVISQSATGTAAKGSTITLTISSGAGSATIPNVVGQTQNDAIAALQAAGFNYSVEQMSSSTVTKGTVIKQSPSSGSGTKGATVTIYVSTGDSR